MPKQKQVESEKLPIPIKDKRVHKTDGILEAMQMEFDMTKDVKLGYVPLHRLANAVSNTVADRRAGRVGRVSALSWVERGPNSNSVGVSNGNIRGTGNDAVTSGRMRAIWVDLADPTHKQVWIGSVSGGLWKTNDINAQPANWSLVNDFLGNLAVTSICQNPANTNEMYFGTGEKTANTDAVRGGGIWKSTNHGVTWNLLPATTGFWNVSRILCDAAGNVYVATIGANGILRSTDGGNTWVNITPASLTSRVTEMRLSSTGRLHIVCGYRNDGISGYRYTDNPATVDPSTWTAPTTSFPTAYNSEIAVAGNILYALPANAAWTTPTIYKSTDGGANWAATPTSPPSGLAEPSINLNQGWFDLAIGVDPSNPNMVIAGGLNFYRSIDGGATWNQITRWVGNIFNYVHADHHTVVWTSSHVLVGTDGGIFYSADNATSFTDRNVGLRTKQFYSCAIHPTNTNYFLAGAQDNGTHQLTNAGLGASVEIRGGDGGYVHIDENEPQYQFASTVYNNYSRSINGGNTWTTISQSPTVGLFINPTDYDDANNKMYTSGSAGTYVRWENPQTGSTFTNVSIGTVTGNQVSNVRVSSHKNNRVFLATTAGEVIRVDNAHTNSPTAVKINGTGMPVNNNVSCINTGTDDNNLIATFSNYGVAHVFVSTTGGGTSGWTNITGNLPDIPVRWAMFYPEDNDKAIIATDMGIFETDDINGTSTVWMQNISFPVVRTNMLQYRPKDGTILAATHGRGLWTTVLPSTVPYIRFASSYNYAFATEETVQTGNLCRKYKDHTVNMRIDKAPTGAASVALNLSGGTAVQGVDFDFTTNGNFTTPSNMLSFADGSVAEQVITIRVYDDAEIEPEESFTLTYSVSGTTNAVAAPSGQSFTFTIAENDKVPAFPFFGSATVGNGSYGGYVQPFRGSFAKSKSQYIYTAAELLAAGVKPGALTTIGFNVTSKGSTIPYSGLSISLKNTASTILSGSFETGVTLCYTGNYSTFVGENYLDFNVTSFTWDGTSNLLVQFCYNNPDNTVTGDDNVSTSITSDSKGVWARTATGTPGCDITTGVLTGITGPIYVRPDIIIPTLLGNEIETGLNATKQEYVSGSGSYYFYTPGVNKVLGSISNATSQLNCASLTVAGAGNTWQSSFAGPRSQKVIDVSVDNSSASYTLGIYFTAAELNGKTASTVRLMGTTAANIGSSDASNSTVYPTTFTSYGSGYLFTATVSGSGRFVLTEANVTSIRNTSRQDNFVRLLQNPVTTSVPLIISNQTRVPVEATLVSSNGQVVKRWNLGRADGSNQLPLNGRGVLNGLYILRINAGSKTQSFKLIVKQ